MINQVIDECYWCEQIKPIYFIDNMWFCCEKCEGAYYDDRRKRRSKNNLPLFIERNRAKLLGQKK